MIPRQLETIKFEKNWYAVYTRSRSERKVFNRLSEESIECFLPTFKTMRQWSDRKKMVEMPLFTSYVFVYIRLKDCYNVITTEGVVRIVSFNSKPAEIPQYQIDNLKILISSNHNFEKTTEPFAPGQKFVVNQGSLKGLIGELVRFDRKNRFLIRIEHMFQNLLVNVPGNHLDRDV